MKTHSINNIGDTLNKELLEAYYRVCEINHVDNPDIINTLQINPNDFVRDLFINHFNFGYETHLYAHNDWRLLISHTKYANARFSDAKDEE